jgi:hypothetical protein
MQIVTFPNVNEICEFECTRTASVVLGLIALYLATAFAMLRHFENSGHRQETWEEAEELKSTYYVEDPLYRAISRIRIRIFPKGRKFNIMDRPRGGFNRPEADLEEPARTERLLHRPLLLCVA